jgi:hypothetical protein
MISEAKYKRLLKEQTDIAIKVYDVVPKTESWTCNQIAAELHRQQKRMDFQKMQGCLDTLKRVGLINEPVPGQFIREAVKEKITLDKLPQAVKENAMTQVPERRADDKVEPTPRATLLTKMAQISSAMMAVSEQMEALAQALDELAIEVDEHLAAAESPSAEREQIERVRAAMKVLLGGPV